MKIKRKIIISFIVILVLGIIYSIEFTSVGYLMTIQFRGFKEIDSKVYLDKHFQGNTEAVEDIIKEAKKRLKNFIGEPQNRATIIITADEKKLNKLGLGSGSAKTFTYVLIGAHSYVILSKKGIDLDIISHELTHTELHYRLYKGKLFHKELIPFWFDEGFGMQNDYREKYDELSWTQVTDSGNNISNFHDLVTSSQFFNEDSEVRKYNYIISKHEVNRWINEHGIDELLLLISELNNATDFNKLYYR